MTTETLLKIALLLFGVTNIMQAVQIGKLIKDVEDLEYISGIFIEVLADTKTGREYKHTFRECLDELNEGSEE